MGLALVGGNPRHLAAAGLNAALPAAVRSARHFVERFAHAARGGTHGGAPVLRAAEPGKSRTHTLKRGKGKTRSKRDWQGS